MTMAGAGRRGVEGLEREGFASAETGFIAREIRLERVDSTNDVVREWLAQGTPEVCLAVADEQLAGRGRAGRTWLAPAGKGLLLSVGFRPTYVAPDRTWRLAAIVALAMADAAEEVAGLRDGAIRLKWPNDLVAEVVDREPAGPGSRSVRKLGGVLGETDGLGTDHPTAVVGIGLNVDWPAAEFPAELAATMSSLRELAGRPVDRDLLLEGFVLRLEPRLLALREGLFDIQGWLDRQVTTGRLVQLEAPDGAVQVVRAVGADGASGGLLVEDESAPGGERRVLTGEIRHVRLADGV